MKKLDAEEIAALEELLGMKEAHLEGLESKIAALNGTISRMNHELEERD